MGGGGRIGIWVWGGATGLAYAVFLFGDGAEGAKYDSCRCITEGRVCVHGIRRDMKK
jgi:hypothetical protein